MYNWNFLDQPLLPYKFHGSEMWGMYFFIFASCELLKDVRFIFEHFSTSFRLKSIDIRYDQRHTSFLNIDTGSEKNMS